MRKHNALAPTIALESTNSLLEDLAVLCDGPSVDLQISLDGGLIAVRLNEKLIFQDSADVRWMRLCGDARARMLSSWIRSAAVKYRNLRSGRTAAREGTA